MNTIHSEIQEWLDTIQRAEALILIGSAGYVITRTEIRTATLWDILEMPLTPCPEWLKAHLPIHCTTEETHHG